MPWAWEVKIAMKDMECNCPPMNDVFREGVGTKEPCPVHPEPDLSDILSLLRPRRDCHGFGGERYDHNRFPNGIKH